LDTQSEAHSSTCQVESDGTGCTCRAREESDSVEDSSVDEVKSVESEPEHYSVASSSPATTSTPSLPVVLDYKSMNKDELVQLCKERNIKGISGKSKDKLIEILQK